MIRKISVFILFMSGMTCHAQSEKADLRVILRAMPEDVLPLLTHNNVLDFIDFQDSKMKAEVDNKLGGRSEMTSLTDSTCHIRLTQASEVDMSLVINGSDSSLVVNHIYHAGKSQSSTKAVYGLDWKRKEL